VEKTESRNLTLNLPEPLLRRFRVYAATHDKSMTQLLTQAILRMLADDDDQASAKRRIIERMRNAKDRGTKGVISWTRDDLHER
jgi:plasmid stability protein